MTKLLLCFLSLIIISCNRNLHDAKTIKSYKAAWFTGDNSQIDYFKTVATVDNFKSHYGEPSLWIVTNSGITDLLMYSIVTDYNVEGDSISIVPGKCIYILSNNGNIYYCALHNCSHVNQSDINEISPDIAIEVYQDKRHNKSASADGGASAPSRR